jgi:hypothetical protein
LNSFGAGVACQHRLLSNKELLAHMVIGPSGFFAYKPDEQAAVMHHRKNRQRQVFSK